MTSEAMGWPEAFVIAVVAVCIAWFFVTMAKEL